jgi:hypothetical protein
VLTHRTKIQAEPVGVTTFKQNQLVLQHSSRTSWCYNIQAEPVGNSSFHPLQLEHGPDVGPGMGEGKPRAVSGGGEGTKKEQEGCC